MRHLQTQAAAEVILFAAHSTGTPEAVGCMDGGALQASPEGLNSHYLAWQARYSKQERKLANREIAVHRGGRRDFV